jgi:hypothetical protein
MRYWSAFLALCLMLGLAGVVRGLLLLWATVPASQEAALRQATMVRIGYTVHKQRKYHTVSNPDELRDLLDGISVVNSSKGSTFSWLSPNGTVEFTFRDGAVLQAVFVYNNQLQRPQWGHLYLKTDFYDKVCVLLSRVEGRPIDVLQNNR